MECAQSCAFRFPKARPGRYTPCWLSVSGKSVPNSHHPTIPPTPQPSHRFSVSPPMFSWIQLLIPRIYTPSGVAEEVNVEAPEEPPSNPNGSKSFARQARPMNEHHIHLAFLDYAPFTSSSKPL